MIIDVGDYNYRITGLPKPIEAELARVYGNAIVSDADIVDFQIDVSFSSPLRKIIKQQVSIKIEGQEPFNPIPPAKLLPSIEWAMNWCVAAYDHSKLLFHAGVAVKNNRAIVFPAQSGSGKSTLSTYLSLSGWQLFSDEMAIIDLNTLKVHPVYRPSSLKNESIDIIKTHFPDTLMSKTTKNTHKGDIAHAMPVDYTTFKTYRSADIAAFVFLNFKPNEEQEVLELEKSVGFAHMLLNSFNYSVIGKPAFEALVSITNKARFFDTTYHDMAFVDDFASDIATGNII